MHTIFFFFFYKETEIENLTQPKYFSVLYIEFRRYKCNLYKETA